MKILKIITLTLGLATLVGSAQAQNEKPTVIKFVCSIEKSINEMMWLNGVVEIPENDNGKMFYISIDQVTKKVQVDAYQTDPETGGAMLETGPYSKFFELTKTGSETDKETNKVLFNYLFAKAIPKSEYTVRGDDDHPTDGNLIIKAFQEEGKPGVFLLTISSVDHWTVGYTFGWCARGK